MKIAIPITATKHFCPHYGTASALAYFETHAASTVVRSHGLLLPIGDTPCSWPDWLRDEGVNILLVGGMGDGARKRCAALGITVIAGVPDLPPAALASAFLAGTLCPGENTCAHESHAHGDGDHSHGDSCHCSH